MKRRLKPQVKAGLIIIVIIAFFILLENGINLTRDFIKNLKAQAEYEQKQQAMQSTEKYKETVYIEDCIQETLKILNSGDYEALYNHLDPEYMAAFSIDSVDKLKQIVDKYLGENPDNISLVKHTKQYGRYICEIAVYKSDNIQKQKILVTPLEDGFYVILDEVETIEKFNGRFKIAHPKIDYTLVYRIVKGKERILVVEAKNKTDKDLKGSFNAVLQQTNRVEFQSMNIDELKDVVIPAGESVQIHFAYNNEDHRMILDDNLKINFVLSDGTELQSVMDLTYHYWE